MANIKSAKKRILTNDRQKGENAYIKATMATYVKKFRALVSEGKLDEATANLKDVVAYIDGACSKGVIHANTASRKVARLTALLDNAKKAQA